MKRFGRIVALAGAVILTSGLAACNSGGKSGSASGGGADGMIEQLTLGDFGGGANPQKNFNPYSPSQLTVGFTFETLFIVNEATCKLEPWLATRHEWKSPTELVLDIRKGVKWSDGKPFGVQDVVSTFNRMKQYPAIDQAGLWKTLASVSPVGTDQVRFAFNAPSVPLLTEISNQKIVPDHIWSKAGDPTKFTNPDGVGTGPFKLRAMNRQQMTLERNPTYWQADKVKVKTLRFLKAEGGGQVEQMRLSRGEFDWNAMFVPSVEKTFVEKDPKNNHYWFPPGASISVYMNLTKAPFNDLAFRKAVAHAINRDEIAKKAQFGYVLTASQTGLVLPAQKDWLSPDIPNEGKIPFSPDEARKLLTAAGYRYDGNKLLGKDGKQVTFSFKTPNGWLDWTQAAGIVQKNLEDIGMKVDVQTPTPEKQDAERKKGDFDMTWGVHGGGCNIYNAYMFPLDSRQSAPVGKDAASNAVRWIDPATDKALDQLRSAETVEQQKPLVHQLQKVMYDNLPTIPLWYGAVWFEYRTKNAVGWPSKDNQYAYPGQSLIIMTKLRAPSASK